METLLPVQVVKSAVVAEIAVALFVVSKTWPEITELALHPEANTLTEYLYPFMPAMTPVRVNVFVKLPL